MAKAGSFVISRCIDGRRRGMTTGAYQRVQPLLFPCFAIFSMRRAITFQ